MKKTLSLALCITAAIAWSCNDNNNTTASGGPDSTHSTTAMTGNSSDSSGSAMKGSTAAANPTNMSSTPLSKPDSSFVMEAAAGGMEEVEMGKLAQQNAANPRVKVFGEMMVRDHSKANDELKSYASSRGLTIPATLPASKQKDIDNMKKMSGRAFDMHYVNMMVEDHKKDVDKFKKESTGADDAQLKTWAGKTLPTLQTHLDSIQAIRNSKM